MGAAEGVHPAPSTHPPLTSSRRAHAVQFTGKEGAVGFGLRKMFEHGPMVVEAVDDKVLGGRG